MTYTAENMNRLLGYEASNEDAVRFAEYLTATGWELIENHDGQMEAWRDDQQMDEQEWQMALEDCFKTHEISLDNGNAYMSAEEAMPIIEEQGLWDAVVEAMNDNTREAVNSEIAPCSNLQLLSRYLEVSPYDLVIG